MKDGRELKHPIYVEQGKWNYQKETSEKKKKSLVQHLKEEVLKKEKPRILYPVELYFKVKET